MPSVSIFVEKLPGYRDTIDDDVFSGLYQFRIDIMLIDFTEEENYRVRLNLRYLERQS